MPNNDNTKTTNANLDKVIGDLVGEMVNEMLQISRKLESLYITRDALADQTDIDLMDEYIGSLEDQIRLIRAITVRKICAVV